MLIELLHNNYSPEAARLADAEHTHHPIEARLTKTSGASKRIIIVEGVVTNVERYESVSPTNNPTHHS